MKARKGNTNKADKFFENPKVVYIQSIENQFVIHKRYANKKYLTVFLFLSFFNLKTYFPYKFNPKNMLMCWLIKVDIEVGK